MLPNMYQVFIFPTKYVTSFYFSQVDKNTIKNEIKNLEISKAIQDSGITVKCLKQNAEFFAEQICCQFNEATCSSVLPASFKLANIAPVFKVGSRNQVSYQSLQKYLKSLFRNNWQAILTTYSQDFNLVSEKVMVPIIVFN